MLVPIIMAIWFGYTAHRNGRSRLGWALGGAALSVAISSVVFNTGAALFGPFRSDDLMAFFAGGLIIAIAITASIGHVIMSNLRSSRV
jgi:hypothetical protein